MYQRYIALQWGLFDNVCYLHRKQNKKKFSRLLTPPINMENEHLGGYKIEDVQHYVNSFHLYIKSTFFVVIHNKKYDKTIRRKKNPKTSSIFG